MVFFLSLSFPFGTIMIRNLMELEEIKKIKELMLETEDIALYELETGRTP